MQVRFISGTADAAPTALENKMKITEGTIMNKLASVWSSTSFHDGGMLHYAMPRITSESRRGVAALSLAAMVFLLLAASIAAAFELGDTYIYTYTALAALSLHIYLSASRVSEVRALYLLAMALLVICGSSMVMIAQQAGKFDMIVISSVAVLFMLVPMVPWGLREASITIGAIYLMFTASTLLTRGRFSAQDMWIFQLLMLFAALVSLLLVIRALVIRKQDLAAQYELHTAHNAMRDLTHRDPLTGAWNRRFLENHFNEIVAAHHAAGVESWFAVFDIDQFKQINDAYGHDQGDLVLRAVEYGFSRLAQENEYLVRMGGDEFAVLLHGRKPQFRIEATLAIIASHASEQANNDGLFPTFSLGLLALPAGVQISFNEAYRLADESLYEAKRSGGNRIVQNPSHSHRMSTPHIQVVSSRQ